MSDAEWAVCEPLLPHPAWLAGKGGRPSAHWGGDLWPVLTAMRQWEDQYAAPDGPPY